jgi:hypothetical protein
MGIWICLVEGDGDEEAVPLLLRRIVYEKFQRWETQFRPYNAHGRGEITDQAKFMRILERALREPNLEAVFIVMDSEGD